MRDDFYALKSGEEVDVYVISQVLGSGGFGITYLADDTNLLKPIALKGIVSGK